MTIFNNRNIQYIFITICLMVWYACAPAASLQPPLLDYVLQFGGEQYALAPDSASLKLGTSFTMMGWFYFDKITNSSILMGHMNNPWSQAPYIGQVLTIRSDGLLEFQISDGSSTTVVTDPDPLATGEWVHIAAVLDAGTMRLYINGVEVGNTAFTGTPTATVTRFSIGMGSTEEPSPACCAGFSGYISQISVWSAGLNATQIQSIAHNGLTGSETGLIAYWKLDDQPESYVARDYGPNALDLRLDQNSYQPFWADTHPLQYPMSAVANPYFKVTEYDWPEEASLSQAHGEDIYILDLDNDGFKDVIVGNVGNGELEPLRVLRNNGDLTFTDVTDTKLGVVNTIIPRRGRVADFNGDGLDDLYIADTGPDISPVLGHQNTLLLGNATGMMTNASSTNLPIIDDADHGLDSGDINGDGSVDLFAGQQGRPCCTFEEQGPEIFINNGAGQFTLQKNRLPSSQLLSVADVVQLLDVDRDGAPEVFLAVEYPGGTPYFPRSAMVMLKNDGKGNFSFPGSGDMIDNEFYYSATKNAIAFASADVNNDGRMDLIASYVIGSYAGTGMWLFINNGDGTFTTIDNAFPSKYFDIDGNNLWLDYLRTGDFNHDGWVDVYSEGSEAGDFLFLNNGDNTFTNASDILSPKINAWGSASNVADLNNDGRLDIIAVTRGKLQVLENMRDYSSGAPPVSTPSAPSLAANGSQSNLIQGHNLSWSETTPAYAFDIQIASDAGFTDIVFQRKDYTGLTIAPAGLSAGQTYYWRMRSKNTRGYSAWSETQSFSVSADDSNSSIIQLLIMIKKLQHSQGTTL